MSLRHHLKLVLFALLIVLGIAAAASLEGIVAFAEAQGRRQILDQYNADVLSSHLNGGSADYWWQQGITAGVTGQLTRIDLFVSVDEESFGETAPTQLSVTLGAPWQSGVPAWTITTVLSSGWNTFNLTNAKIFIAAGDEYAIGIHGQSAHNFNPGFGFSRGNESGDQYLDGQLFLNGSTIGSEGNDLLFRTYVRPER